MAESVAAVDQRVVCLECHDLESELDAAVAHQPAQDGECSSCHNPHASRFSGLLLSRPATLCATCHSEIDKELELSLVHEPVASGRCTSCHQPHGGNNDNLLVATGAELCGSCHPQVTEWLGRKVEHGPFRRQKCGLCHEAHASEYPHLSRRPAAKACLRCHKPDAGFRSAHSGYPVDRRECSSCHDPHAAADATLLRSQVHFPFAEGECSDCHAAADAKEPFELNASIDRLCGDCHDDVVEDSRAAAFPHVGGEVGDGCVSCHDPHASSYEAMLSDRTQKFCLDCHDPGGSSSFESGRYATHGDDLSCSTCHAPHGGDRPLLLVAEPAVLCSECHSHQHIAAHPMGKDAIDPRNRQPMDCLSCHGIHDAPYPKYMHRDGDRELCVACHTELSGRPVGAKP